MEKSSNILNELTVLPSPFSHKRMLKAFGEEFLGVTKAGKSCKIVNENDIRIRFDPQTNTLFASSDNPVVVINEYLGYKISFSQLNFQAEYSNTSLNQGRIKRTFYTMTTSFLDLYPDDEIIKKRREATYENSRAFFFKNFANNTLKEAGFKIYKIAFFLNTKTRFQILDVNEYYTVKDTLSQKMIQPVPAASFNSADSRKNALNRHLAGIKTINAAYRGKVSNVTVLTDTLLIDRYGNIDKIDKVQFSGEMGKYRAGDMLPVDYAHAQTIERSSTTSFVKNIDDFSHLYPQEKVFLHFDNTAYYIGETMWFQSYAVSAETLRPEDLSRVLYVEMLNARGDVVLSRKLKIENGRAPGDFFLRDTLKAGFYEVRAYTRAMLNFGEECIFSRVFPVYPQPRRPGEYTSNMPVDTRNRGTDGVTREQPPRPNRVNMSFFPEGGNMVEGLPCKVAFKATGRQGEDIEVTGMVHNAAKEPVAFFSTMHNGMGFFEITPQKEEYTVIATHEGSEYKFKLPQVQPAGYSMRAGSRQETLTVQIGKTADVPPEQLGVTVSCRGKVCGFEEFTVTDRPALLQFPVSQIPAGVVQITLFNEAGKVFAERMTFIRHEDSETHIKTTGINSTFAPYSPISATFQTGDSTAATFSLSVRDLATDIYTGYTDNVMSNLLLSGDLRGYVHNPAWYFEGNDAGRRQALDLLLMVQGWRRYDWETMASDKPFEVKHPMEKEIFIDGKVLDIRKDAPQENIDVGLWMSGDNLSQRGECVTDHEGRFNFGLTDFYGTWKMSLQTKEKGKPKEFRILLNRNFGLTPQAYSYHDTNFPLRSEKSALHPAPQQEQPSEIIADRNDSINFIQELVITGKRSHAKLQAMRYSNFVYDMQAEEDRIRDMGLPRSGLFIDYLEQNFNFSYSFGEFRYRTKPVVFKISGDDNDILAGYNDYAPTPMKRIEELLVDEVTSFWIDEDGKSPAATVSMLKQDPVTGVWAIRGQEPVVIYVFWKPAFSEPKGIRNTTFQGYSRAREFYHPYYGNGMLPEMPDFRRTLYWNPAVGTDEEGKVTVQFYNSGTCRELVIDAETY